MRVRKITRRNSKIVQYGAHIADTQVNESNSNQENFETKSAEIPKPKRQRWSDAFRRLGTSLANLVHKSDTKHNQSKHVAASMSVFACKPTVSLCSYLLRLTHCIEAEFGVRSVADRRTFMASDTSTRVVVLALIYIDRITSRYSVEQPPVPSPKLFQGHNFGSFINSSTIHLLLLTAIMTATKLTEDMQRSHRIWAHFGGVSKLKLAALERTFCSLCEFRFYVKPEEYEEWYQRIRVQLIDPILPKFMNQSDLQSTSPNMHGHESSSMNEEESVQQQEQAQYQLRQHQLQRSAPPPTHPPPHPSTISIIHHGYFRNNAKADASQFDDDADLIAAAKQVAIKPTWLKAADDNKDDEETKEDNI